VTSRFTGGKHYHSHHAALLSCKVVENKNLQEKLYEKKIQFQKKEK